MNQLELKDTIRYILEHIDDSRKVLSSAVSIKDKLIDLTFEQVISEQEFYKISSVLSPQSRSPMWKNFFIEKHDCERVNKNEERGILKRMADTTNIKVLVTIRIILFILFKLDRGKIVITLFSQSPMMGRSHLFSGMQK